MFAVDMDCQWLLWQFGARRIQAHVGRRAPDCQGSGPRLSPQQPCLQLRTDVIHRKLLRSNLSFPDASLPIAHEWATLMGDQRENLPSSPHSSVITRLKNVLADLHSNPSPHIPEPPSCKKRASVALVIRIRAQFPYRSTYNPNTCSNSNTSFRSRLDAFFEQEWVQTGEPEILFMKRAARTGDRWTGHVAFPGGKREAGDADDEEASVRETREEVGLDLRAPHCLQIGNLPQRVITTNWGKVPYVFSTFPKFGEVELKRLLTLLQHHGPVSLRLPALPRRFFSPISPTYRSPFRALGLPSLPPVSSFAILRAQ